MAISVTGTTPDPKTIQLSDTDYAFYLVMKDLVQAINKLASAMRTK